jgi:hypothetical protein
MTPHNNSFALASRNKKQPQITSMIANSQRVSVLPEAANDLPLQSASIHDPRFIFARQFVILVNEMQNRCIVQGNRCATIAFAPRNGAAAGTIRSYGKAWNRISACFGLSSR